MTAHTNKLLTRYYVMFGIAYIIIIIIMALIKHFLNGSLTGVSMLTPWFTAMIVGEQFLKRERRLPTILEKSKLVWGGLIIVITFNVLIFALVWTAGGYQEEIPSTLNLPALFTFLTVFFIFVLIGNYFLMRWAFGRLLLKRAEKLKIDIQ